MPTTLPDISTSIFQLYEAMRPQWVTSIWPNVLWLFRILALIEFSVAAAWIFLERNHSIEETLSSLLRVVLVIGFFYTLVVHGLDWMTWIIDSFEVMGQRASGLGPLSPGDVLVRGLNLMNEITSFSSARAYFLDPAATLSVILATLLIVLSFAMISALYLVALIEAFVGLTAGMIFLGFGGARWTRPYVERYIAYAIATGVKIMVMYFLIGGGLLFTATWQQVLRNAGLNHEMQQGCFAIMGGALTFLMVCWQVPKWFAGLVGGAPALTGGDLIGTASAIAGTAAFATYVTAKTLQRATSSSASQISGASAARSLPPAGSTPQSVPAPQSSSGAAGGGSAGSAGTPRPPSSSGGRGAGFAGGRAGRLPSDHAPAPSPPKMPIDRSDD